MEAAFVSMRLSCSLMGGGGGMGVGWIGGKREGRMETGKKGKEEVKEREQGVHVQGRLHNLIASAKRF
jgi:hypothetical protein